MSKIDPGARPANPPRTQAALLEAMAERRVTVDGQTYTLEPPFVVVATQNPIDHEGTFPLSWGNTLPRHAG